MEELQNLLKAIGPGQTGYTAYDTAWIARLVDIEPNIGNNALQWICDHQLVDGSWGAEHPKYYHDRIVSTLSAMIALTHRGHYTQNHQQIEKGIQALEWISSGATWGLAADPNGATVGFEMIVPALVTEAERLGIIKQQGDRILGQFGRLRKAKMAKLDGLKINRNISAAFSAEMAGTDMQDLLEIENLQEVNGSVGDSPSATAFFSLLVRHEDQKALGYLRNIVKNGGAPFAAPFDVFERAWVLWNLALIDNLDSETLTLCQPHLDFLEAAWRPGFGVGFAANYTPCDGDCTSMTFDALAQFGRKPDINAILSYEEKDHFRCYSIEVNPSTGVNVHILGALHHIGLEKTHPTIQKIIRFLRKTRIKDQYWLDKWHTSPYYITAHAIKVLQGYDDDLCRQAIDWIIKTQNKNGAWGFYGRTTAEETAYCVQALELWRRYGGKVPIDQIKQGAEWLWKNAKQPYPPMWISKALYCPELVVQSVILSALELVKGLC